MKSATLRTAIVMLSLSLASACATPMRVTQHASGCAELVPIEWAAGVEGAPLPRLNADRTDWQVFGEKQTGQLDKANGRTRDAIGIVSRCEARDQAVADRLNAPWWKRPFVRKHDRG